MPLPQVDISPGHEIEAAASKLEAACRQEGILLISLDGLNRLEPYAGTCRFYQATIDHEQTIVVVIVGEWTNDFLVSLLNILLEIRTDPDPPGAMLRFRFLSSHAIPALFATFFGDHLIAPLECRAAVLARFGDGLQAEECTRLGAAAAQLLKGEGIQTGFADSEGLRVLSLFVRKEIRARRFPQEGTPMNLLICLGALYGELIRSRLPCESRWAMVKEYMPWPCLVLAGKPALPQGSAAAGSGSGDVRRLGFSPIAVLFQLSQEGADDLLETSLRQLEDRIRQEFGEVTQPVTRSR